MTKPANRYYHQAGTFDPNNARTLSVHMTSEQMKGAKTLLGLLLESDVISSYAWSLDPGDLIIELPPVTSDSVDATPAAADLVAGP